jgi:Arc/MetJ-type ribon-helix-helix transcriptional regulator
MCGPGGAAGAQAGRTGSPPLYHDLCYGLGMSAAISVRLDDEAERALAQLEASGLSRSEAIRRALIEAANRQRRSTALAAEAAALESDPDDRAEMRAVAEFMGALDG